MLATKEKMKEKIISSLDKLEQDDFLELYDLVARRAAEKLIESVTSKWEAGQISADKIEEAKEKYRSEHPYQAS